MSTEIGTGISIGTGVIIGQQQAIGPVVINPFISEDFNYLVSETGNNFVEE